MSSNLPIAGVAAEQTVTPSEFLLDDHVIEKGITVDNSARDSGNTPTTTLRPGLVMGKITASGKYAQYDDIAADGTEDAVGILKDQVKVVDSDGNASDAAAVIVIHGRVDESALIGVDAAAETDLAGQIIFD